MPNRTIVATFSAWTVRWAVAWLFAYLWLGPLLALSTGLSSDHDAERLLQLALFVLTAIAFAFDRAIGAVACRYSMQRRTVVLLSMVVALALMSAIRCRSPQAWIEFSLWCGLALCTACVARTASEAEMAWLNWGVLIAGSTYALLLFGLCLAIMFGGDALLRSELFPGYSNYRFYNHVQTVLVPLLALISLAAPLSRWARMLAYGALAFNFALLFFTAGRATLLGLLIGCGLVALVAPRLARPWLTRMAAGAAIGVLIYAVLFVTLPHWLGVRTEMTAAEVAANAMSIDRRFYLWRIALDYVRESPWLGIGPMQFAHRPNTEAAHPHNLPLQIASEWGLPMLLLVLAAAGCGLLRLLRVVRVERDPQEAAVGAGLLAACVAVAVDSCFSGNFVMPMSQMWISLLFGWAIAWTRARAPASTAPTIAIPRTVVALGVAAVLGLQLWVPWAIRDQLRDLDGYLDSVRANVVRNDHDSPRFWSHGWF